MPPQTLAINDFLTPNQFFYATPIVLEAPTSTLIVEEVHLSIPDLIRKYGNATSTEIATAIIETESNFNPSAKNPKSTAYGLFQFTKGTWKEECKGDRTDVESQIKCGMTLIDKEEFYQWESSMSKWLPALATSTREYVQSKMKYCSCVVYVAQRIDLPPIKTFFDLNSNTMPGIGTVALLNYNGIAHGGIIRNITEKGIIIDEANWKRCQETKNRFISFEEMKRVSRGFWKPLE